MSVRQWFTVPGRRGDRTIDEQRKGLDRLFAACDGRTVLDVGCAEGLLAREFVRRGARSVHGVEIVHRHIGIAKDICAGLPITFEQADVNDWEPTQRYDIVAALAVLHKLWNPSAACARLAAAARWMFVLRLPPEHAPSIVDWRSGDEPHDIAAVMRDAGFELAHTDRGHFDEWVGLWERGVNGRRNCKRTDVGASRPRSADLREIHGAHVARTTWRAVPQASRSCRHRDLIRKIIRRFNARTLLDYGSGRGDAYSGADALHRFWGVARPELYDPAFPTHDTLPPRVRFDGVLCSDVLEHIHPEDVERVIDDLFGHAERFVWASVCTRRRRSVPERHEHARHVQPIEWWHERFTEAAARYPGVEWCLTETH